VEVSTDAFKEVLRKAASEIVLLDLTVEGDAKPKRLALVQEAQYHVLSGALLHVDFHEVAEDEKVTIMVPVEPVGEAAGVKTGGGVLEHVLYKVKVRALPKNLPEVIGVDVSALEIGKAIHLGDIKPGEGIEILGDKHVTVLSVAAPVSEVVETAATTTEAPAAGDVEMLKEKKEEGAEGGAADAKGGAKAAGDKKGEKAPAGDKKAEKAPAAEKKAEKKK
jgi:large subunit ribosomal protein L25